MDYSAIIKDGRLSIPQRFLLNNYRQLKLNAVYYKFSDGYAGISYYLENSYENLKANDLDFFNICLDNGLKLGDKTIERAIGRNPEAGRYILLDFICYMTCNKRTLADVILNDYKTETEFKYSVEIPEYAKEEIACVLAEKQFIKKTTSSNIPTETPIPKISPDFEPEDESLEIDNNPNPSLPSSSLIEGTDQQIEAKKDRHSRSIWHKIKKPTYGIVFLTAIGFALLVKNRASSHKILFHDFSIKVDENSNVSDYKREFFTHGFDDNTTGGQDCPVVSIVDEKRYSLPRNGCWENRIIKVDSQTQIKVIVYCHNTDENKEKNLRIKLRQYKFLYSNKTIFSIAIINSNSGDTVGMGYVEATYPIAKNLMFESIYQYKDKKLEEGKLLDNGEDIFSDHGLSITEIPGYSDCPIVKGHKDAACHERWLMATFRVTNEFSPFPDRIDGIPFEYETSLEGFNDNAGGIDCHTLSVSNGTTGKSADGCWGTRDITIDMDQSICIIFYYHNTSVFADTNVRIKLKVLQDNLLDEKNMLKKTTFQGTILFNEHDSVVGYANVFSYRPKRFSFVVAKLHPNQSDIGTRLLNADQIFSTQGLRILDIPGYTDCPMPGSSLDAFCHQGWIDLSFVVRNQ